MLCSACESNVIVFILFVCDSEMHRISPFPTMQAAAQEKFRRGLTSPPISPTGSWTMIKSGSGSPVTSPSAVSAPSPEAQASEPVASLSPSDRASTAIALATAFSPDKATASEAAEQPVQQPATPKLIAVTGGCTLFKQTDATPSFQQRCLYRT